MTSTASILAVARMIEDMNRMEEFLEEEERIRRVLGEDERTRRLLKDLYLDSEGKEMFQAQQRLNLALSRQKPRSRSFNTTPTTGIAPSHTPIEANNAVIKVIPQQTEPKNQATPVRAIEPSSKDSLEFIRLATVVTRIANCVQLEPHLDDSATAIGDISRAAADKFWKENNPKIERARKFGIAALILNKALHCSATPPQWMEFDKQKCFSVKNDAVKQEGIELLTHAAGWGNREQSNYSLHFFNAITQGEDALAMPIVRGLNDGQVPDGKMLQFLNIGFDRAELVAFLDKNQIGHDLTPRPAPVPQDEPVVAVGASGGVSWTPIRPQRFQGYGKPLYDLLRAAHVAVQPCPTARDVLDTWKIKPPPEVPEVMSDGMKYFDAKGNTKPADLKAISKAIGRMTR